MKGAGSEKKRHSNIWFWSYIMKRRLQAPQRIAVAPRVLLVQKVKCALGSQHSLPSRPGLLHCESGCLEERARQGDPGGWEGDWRTLGEVKREGATSRTPTRVPGRQQRLDIALGVRWNWVQSQFATCQRMTLDGGAPGAGQDRALLWVLVGTELKNDNTTD